MASSSSTPCAAAPATAAEPICIPLSGAMTGGTGAAPAGVALMPHAVPTAAVHVERRVASASPAPPTRTIALSAHPPARKPLGLRIAQSPCPTPKASPVTPLTPSPPQTPSTPLAAPIALGATTSRPTTPIPRVRVHSPASACAQAALPVVSTVTAAFAASPPVPPSIVCATRSRSATPTQRFRVHPPVEACATAVGHVVPMTVVAPAAARPPRIPPITFLAQQQEPRPLLVASPGLANPGMAAAQEQASRLDDAVQRVRDLEAQLRAQQEFAQELVGALVASGEKLRASEAAQGRRVGELEAQCHSQEADRRAQESQLEHQSVFLPAGADHAEKQISKFQSEFYVHLRSIEAKDREASEQLSEYMQHHDAKAADETNERQLLSEWQERVQALEAQLKTQEDVASQLTNAKIASDNRLWVSQYAQECQMKNLEAQLQAESAVAEEFSSATAASERRLWVSEAAQEYRVKKLEAQLQSEKAVNSARPSAANVRDEGLQEKEAQVRELEDQVDQQRRCAAVEAARAAEQISQLRSELYWQQRTMAARNRHLETQLTQLMQELVAKAQMKAQDSVARGSASADVAPEELQLRVSEAARESHVKKLEAQLQVQSAVTEQLYSATAASERRLWVSEAAHEHRLRKLQAQLQGEQVMTTAMPSAAVANEESSLPRESQAREWERRVDPQISSVPASPLAVADRAAERIARLQSEFYLHVRSIEAKDREVSEQVSEYMQHADAEAADGAKELQVRLQHRVQELEAQLKTQETAANELADAKAASENRLRVSEVAHGNQIRKLEAQLHTQSSLAEELASEKAACERRLRLSEAAQKQQMRTLEAHLRDDSAPANAMPSVAVAHGEVLQATELQVRELENQIEHQRRIAAVEAENAAEEISEMRSEHYCQQRTMEAAHRETEKQLSELQQKLKAKVGEGRPGQHQQLQRSEKGTRLRA